MPSFTHTHKSARGGKCKVVYLCVGSEFALPLQSEKCEKLLFLADLVGWGMGGSPAAPGSCASGDGLPSICHVSGATRGS